MSRGDLPVGDDELRVEAPDFASWYSWLEEHHERRRSVWLVFHKKASPVPSITWPEAVDGALCFGWIDSKARPIDDLRYEQWFSVRKASSGWSKVNKEKIERLVAGGLMRPAGRRAIDLAKANGSWSLLDDVEALVVPPDLAAALAATPGATEGFEAYPRSATRNVLQWIVLAKRPDTRARRIAATAEAAARGERPNGI